MSQVVIPSPSPSIPSFQAHAGFEPSQERLAHLLGQPIRFGILHALATHETLSFSELKRLVKLTDGNLSMHARKLEDAQVVNCTKGFRGRFPRTEYRLTAEGRAAFLVFVATRSAI